MLISESKKSNRWYIAGLILLGVVPVVAGMVRLAQLGRGTITSENERFFASPSVIIIHIIAVSIYSLLGAFQFSSEFRQRSPSWHRRAGKFLIPLGMLAALTGLWMTQFYPFIKYDGLVLYWIRMAVGVSMFFCIVIGVHAVQARNFKTHGAWMMRAYGLGIGAGTQVLTHIPWFVFPSIQGETARTVCMAMGWIINVAVVEWIIKKGKI